MKLLGLLDRMMYAVLKTAVPVEEIEIESLTCDSKTVQNNDIFFCIEGTAVDGHDYIEEAWENGANVCVVEKLLRKGKLLHFPEGMTVLLVKDTRAAFSEMAAAYFDYPAERMHVIGVTGTKGKTTVTHMITEMLNASGHKTGRIGTLGIQIGDVHFETKNTTPDAFTIQKYFAKMIEMGCEYAVIEVSSQSMKQKRVEGILFEAAVFTNFAPDHIGTGEHKNVKEYRYYKSLLFKQTKRAIGNLDDMECSYMFHQTDCEKYGYTCMEPKCLAESQKILKAEHIRCMMDEKGPLTRFEVEGQEYLLRLPGIFNVYNILAAMFTLRILGIDPSTDAMKKMISELEVNGRMQRIDTDKNIVCYIDYAHNALSLEQVLTTMKQYEPRHLILVFGCGGNRAKDRRTKMGEVAGRYADLTVITSDNPRNEKPWAIVQDIVSGMKRTEGKYQIIIDRKEAVRYALAKAQNGDVVIIAGKGHETYQEIEGVRYPMSDAELVREAGKTE